MGNGKGFGYVVSGAVSYTTIGVGGGGSGGSGRHVVYNAETDSWDDPEAEPVMGDYMRKDDFIDWILENKK